MSLALGLPAGKGNAFAPPATPGAHEVPLPFERGNLVYGSEAASLAAPGTAASMGEMIGGAWSVHSWNRRSGTPHSVVGSGAEIAPALGSASDAELAAHNVLARLSSALRVNPDQLRIDEVRDGAGKYAVHFQQTYDGLDVLGGRVHATFLDTGRLFVLGSDFYPILGLNVIPAIGQAEAERIAVQDLPHQERNVSSVAGEETNLYVLPYPTSLESFEARLVWKVTVETDGRTGVFHTYLDANTGQVLWRQNDVHYVDFIGSTEGNVQHTSYCDGEGNQRLKYMEVVIEGVGQADSDENGDWAIEDNNNIPRIATTSFFGSYVDVNLRNGEADAVQSGIASPGFPLAFIWTDSNARQDERDVFDAVSDMHDFFDHVDYGYPFAHERMTANVGEPSTCNAFWNGQIHFYSEGDGCANTGEIQGVVHHEYGHGVQHDLIGSQGQEGCGEGNSDILANFMTDEPIIGRGFHLGLCAEGIRTSDNDRQYPEDLNGQVHNDGQIIAGVMWDVRQNLEGTMGSAGKDLAAILWHYGRKLEQPTNQPDQCLSMFIIDDDDGDLSNGTPNFLAICDAMRAHDIDRDGFICPEINVVWVDFDYVGPEDGSESRPYNSIFQAESAAPNHFTMKIRSGNSAEVGTLSKRGMINAIGGAVRIGTP